MLKKSECIVFNSIKYGDSGRIITVYSKEEGLMTFITQGLNSKHNLRKTHFQHLNILDINYYRKKNNSIQRLKDSKIAIDNSNLDIPKLYIVIFTAELLKLSIKEEEANQQLYSFLKQWIENLHLETQHDIQFLLKFCIDISSYLGFAPMNNEGQYFNLLEGCFDNSIKDSSYTLSENASNLFKKLIKNENDFATADLRENLNSIMRFYSCHLSNFKTPKSIKMLETIWL